MLIDKERISSSYFRDGSKRKNANVEMWVLCPFRRITIPEFPGACLCHSVSPVPPFVSYPHHHTNCVLMHTEQMLFPSWLMAIYQEGCEGNCSSANFLMAPLPHRLQTSVQTPVSLCMGNRMLHRTPFVLYENGFFIRDNKSA